jgi:hypothetical protein
MFDGCIGANGSGWRVSQSHAPYAVGGINVNSDFRFQIGEFNSVNWRYLDFFRLETRNVRRDRSALQLALLGWLRDVCPGEAVYELEPIQCVLNAADCSLGSIRGMEPGQGRRFSPSDFIRDLA